MFGNHVAFSSDLSLASVVSECLERGEHCCQLFLGNPKTAHQRRSLKKDDSKLVVELCNANIFRVYTHFPYTFQLAAPQTAHTMRGLQAELNTLAPFRGRIVIHPNTDKCSCTVDNKTYRNNSNTITQYQEQSLCLSKSLRRNLLQLQFAHDDFPLLLEPPAGEGTRFGWSFEHYALIREAVNGLPVGLCIDTCHTFAAGLCRFDTDEAVTGFFAKLRELDVLRLVKAIHFNDSAEPFASYKDVHAPIAGGYIWGYEEHAGGLAALIRECYRYSIDIICEMADPIDTYTARVLLEKAEIEGVVKE